MNAATREEITRMIDESLALTMPAEWFDDAHAEGQHPRCCELRESLLATIDGFIAAEETAR